ncbi:hypothetical protein ACVW0J_000162 [Bradyrhizobium sp. i1.7.7]
MREDVAPQVGDDALADRHHEVVSRGAGKREHGDHRDHHREVAVDQRDAFRRQAEIDHPPHSDGHQQRGQRRDRERDEGERRAAAIARHIGRECQQRPQLGAALRRRLDQLGFDRRGLRPGALVAVLVVKPFHSAHEIGPKETY